MQSHILELKLFCDRNILPQPGRVVRLSEVKERFVTDSFKTWSDEKPTLVFKHFRGLLEMYFAATGIHCVFNASRSDVMLIGVWLGRRSGQTSITMTSEPKTDTTSTTIILKNYLKWLGLVFLFAPIFVLCKSIWPANQAKNPQRVKANATFCSKLRSQHKQLWKRGRSYPVKFTIHQPISGEYLPAGIRSVQELRNVQPAQIINNLTCVATLVYVYRSCFLQTPFILKGFAENKIKQPTIENTNTQLAPVTKRWIKSAKSKKWTWADLKQSGAQDTAMDKNEPKI